MFELKFTEKKKEVIVSHHHHHNSLEAMLAPTRAKETAWRTGEKHWQPVLWGPF